MYLLRAEFEVTDYAEWKKAFDSDPAGRQKSGVSQYCIMRPVNDEKYVLVDFEFEAAAQAEAFLASLRKVWEDVGTKIVKNPAARIVEESEFKKLK